MGVKVGGVVKRWRYFGKWMSMWVGDASEISMGDFGCMQVSLGGVGVSV